MEIEGESRSVFKVDVVVDRQQYKPCGFKTKKMAQDAADRVLGLVPGKVTSDPTAAEPTRQNFQNDTVAAECD